MINLFKNKSIGFFVGLGGGVVGLITTIIYLAYTLTVGLFAPEVFVLLLLATLSTIPGVFLDWKFLPLIPVILFSLALGFHLCDRVTMFQEMINKIYGMNEKGAILGVVILLLVLNLVSVAASLVAAFTSRERKDSMATA